MHSLSYLVSVVKLFQRFDLISVFDYTFSEVKKWSCGNKRPVQWKDLDTAVLSAGFWEQAGEVRASVLFLLYYLADCTERIVIG